MPVYLIHGPSGSGKSTVGRVLRQRGYRVIETDFEDGLSAWFDNDTGQKVTSLPAHPFPPEWVASHSWLWDKKRVEDLVASSGDEPMFFCGGAYNQTEFYDLLKKRFGLWVDSATLIERLQPREPARWSDGSAELSRLLAWNEKFRDYCKARGDILIDSSVSPESVTNTILKQL